MHIRDLAVEVRDKDLNRLGQITEPFLDILVEDQFNNVGSWELRLPSDHPLAPALLTPGAGIVITTHDGETLFSGPTIQPEDATTVQEPAGVLTIKGLSDTVILADRLAFPDPSNVDPTTQTLSHDVRTGPVETLMHEYVSANIGPSAPTARRDLRLQMGANGARGDTITKKARFPVLGDLLAEMAAPESLGFRVVQVDNHLEFQTYEVLDRTDGVRLDVRNNTLAGHRIAIAPPGATHVIVAGQGELEDRTFRLYTTVDSLAAAEEWGRRIEKFVDQRQTDDPSELDRAGLEVLAEEGFSQIAVQVVPMENFSIEYGHDWSMGDRIVVVVRGAEMSAIVTGYVLRNNADGFRMGAILGDPTGFDTGNVAARVTKIESRVSNLERGAETVVNLGPRLTALEAAADALPGELDDINTDLVALDGRVTTAESDITTIESSVTTLDGRLDTVESDIDDLQADVVAAQFPNANGITHIPPATLSTTSTSYSNVTGAAVSLTKRQSSTKLRVAVALSFYNTEGTTGAVFAVRIGGTDYFIGNNVAATDPLSHKSFAAVRYISGISAGSVTVQLRWKRGTGTGTLIMVDAGGETGSDFISMDVMEVSS